MLHKTMVRSFPQGELKPNGKGEYKEATHIKSRHFNHRLHKSKYISHHTVHDQKFENNKYCCCEADLYDRSNIQTTVSHVSGIDNHERDGNMMAVRTTVAHDKTVFATMTVLSQLTKEIADGKSYQFTNVVMGCYRKEQVF